MTFYPLEKLANLHDDYRKVFAVEQHNMLLLQHEGSLYLIEAWCPHAGYPLDDGVIIGPEIRCGMHGYLFNLASGSCTYSPEGPCRSLKTWDVAVEQGQVGVKLQGNTGQAGSDSFSLGDQHV